MTTNQSQNSHPSESDKGRGLKTDYYHNPVLARNSIGQLLQRPGLMGFSNLVWASGDWRGLASPFCRLGRENPERIVCEAEFVRQESKNAVISAAFSGADSISIEVKVRGAMRLYSGAPGKIYHNGGTAHQQWMAFDAFRGGATLNQEGSDLIIARNGSYCAVFVAPGIEMAADGNGWSLDLKTGTTFLGTGIAFQDEGLAEERARAALSRLQSEGGITQTRQRLLSEWEQIYRKFPLGEFEDPLDESLARNAVWCLYSNLASPEGCLRRPSIMGAKIQYPGVFPWDSAFAAVALKEGDPELAKNQIELYTDVLRESVSGRVSEMTVLHSGGGVQFPLFSWAAWRIHSACPDESFLERVYEPLAKHAAWWTRDEAASEGIPLYDRVICLDDSPRFDMFAAEGRMSLQEPVFGADLIALCAWDQLHLARIAEELGRERESRMHRAAADRMMKFAEDELYDSSLGRYVDISVESRKKGTVNTPMNHFPAFLSPSRERRRMAAKALSSSGPFWGRFGLATVSPEETSFDPCRIWRGPIWFSINFLCAQACTQMGFPHVAEEIALSTIGIIRSNSPLPKGIMEYFNYQTGEGSGAHHIATMSAAPYLSFLLGHHREGLGRNGVSPVSVKEEEAVRAFA